LDLITDGKWQRVDFTSAFYDFLTGIKHAAARSWDRRPRSTQQIRLHGADSGPGRPRCVAEYRQLRSITDAPGKCPYRPLHTGRCINGGEIIATAKPLPKPSADRQQRMKSLVARSVKYIHSTNSSFACHPSNPDLFLEVIARTVAGVNPTSACTCVSATTGRGPSGSAVQAAVSAPGQAKVTNSRWSSPPRNGGIELARESNHDEPRRRPRGRENTWIRPPELIAERLRLVLKHIEPERVAVTPDCGFSPNRPPRRR